MNKVQSCRKKKRKNLEGQNKDIHSSLLFSIYYKIKIKLTHIIWPIGREVGKENTQNNKEENNLH